MVVALPLTQPSHLLRFGWEELKLRRILATVEQGNDASTHILQKLRFVVIETEECRQQRHRRL
jgi:RimJ/RimL family protein N-acetyltransferase